MKTAILSAIVLSVVACGEAKTNSASEVKVADNNTATFQYPTLPVLEMPSIKISEGPAMAAVQPTAHLIFSYSSCSTRSFEVKTQTVNSFGGKNTYVQVNKVHAIDCKGPAISREYTVQISSDSFADGAYILSNPSMIRTNSR